MGFGFGIGLNELENISSDIPLLFWIDEKVNNEENNNYKKMFEKNINIKIFSFTTTSQAINYLKKVKFNKIFIICGGYEYILFIKKFKNDINDYMICPKIIIFTRDKSKYLNRNSNNKELYIGDEFYNKGGVEDKYIEVEKFIKNELEEKKFDIIIESESSKFSEDNLDKMLRELNKSNKNNEEPKIDSFPFDDDCQTLKKNLYETNNGINNPDIKNNDVINPFSSLINNPYYNSNNSNNSNIKNNDVISHFSYSNNNPYSNSNNPDIKNNDTINPFSNSNNNPYCISKNSNLKNSKISNINSCGNFNNSNIKNGENSNINPYSDADNINLKKDEISNGNPYCNFKNSKLKKDENKNSNIINLSNKKENKEVSNSEDEKKKELELLLKEIDSSFLNENSIHCNKNNNNSFLLRDINNSKSILSNYNLLNKEHLIDKISQMKMALYFENDDHMNDMIQYNFERIGDLSDLIVPIYFSFYMKNLEEKEIQQFINYMLILYKEKQIQNIFSQLFNVKNIPKEIISKFWIRAYTANSKFYQIMNEDLRKNCIDDYLAFIIMMYEGIKIRSFSFKPKYKLYRGTYFNEYEIKELEYYIKFKITILPAAIVYSRSFMSFSLNKKVAMKFKKNVLLIINKYLEEKKYTSGCAEIKNFSYYQKEDEILVFPFSCFEIEKIEKEDNYYIIYLGYLGKYEKLFQQENPINLISNIPKNSFLANDVFNTNLIKDEYKEIFFNNYFNGGGGGYGGMISKRESHLLDINQYISEEEALKVELK